MTQQAFNFDAQQAKHSAIQQSEDGSLLFVLSALEVLERIARRKTTLTSLDVWKAYQGPTPNNPRAMGAVFVRAAREGLIRRTNQRIKSGRVSDHNQELAVWESLVFGCVKN